jgi:hypothetical protein
MVLPLDHEVTLDTLFSTAEKKDGSSGKVGAVP